jgi:hypothetical protein
MERIRATSTALLSLLLVIAAPAYAQREQQGEKQDHPQEQQTKHEQAKPEQQHAQPQRQPEQKQQQPQHAQQQQRQDQNKQTQQHAQQQQRQDQNKQTQQHAQQQQRQDQNKQTQQHAQQQQRQDQNKQTQQHAQQQQSNQRPQRTEEQQRVEQSAWQQHRSGRWESDHRTWQQRGGYNGYRIPDDRFRGYFGEGHGFRIYGLPFLVVGGFPRFQYNGYWFSMIDPYPESWASDWYDTDDVYVAYVDNGYYLYDRRYPGVGIAINISR